MSELKTCPFCGNGNIFVGTVAEVELQDETHEDYAFNTTLYVAVCDYNNNGCGSSSAICRSESEAIEAWNRRVGE